MATDFKLPELGENITAGDVLRVLVKPGDVLAKDQPVLELETDKATIEVPSSVAGRVTDVSVKAGEKVTVGQVILRVEDAQADAKAPTPAGKSAAVEATAPSQTAAPTPPAGAAPAESSDRRSETKPAQAPAEGEEGGEEGSQEEPAEEPSAKGQPAAERSKVVEITRGARAAASESRPADLPIAPAAPSVRRMARELGVDINKVTGSGPSGRISIDDVKGFTKRIVTGAASAQAVAEPLPDFTRWGDVDRQPMRPVRRKTAEHLSAAWAAIPHVTQHELADITSLEELRKRYAKQAEAAGGSLTITAIAVKVVAAALKIFPQLNSSIDVAGGAIIYKKYVNIGIAVDTDRGLLVPVIRDADTKNITQISVELLALSEKARTRKISLDEMQGGTFSISNLGGIGGTFFTPLVNLPEVAILGISRGRMEPVYTKETGQFVPRLMLPLSLSYDHRVVDGAEGIRFLRWVTEALEQPFLLELQG